MSIRAQYERWPYPQVSLLASVPRTEVTQLHSEHLRDRAGLGPGPARPRIWMAGCGTWQPYVWGVANPHAEILGSDLSSPSLKRAQWHCGLHGVRNVRFSTVDLNEDDTFPEGPFDIIESYGVLMNLRDPAAALSNLTARLAPDGLLRLMVYPWYSRRRIFQLQRVARLLGLVPAKPGDPGIFRRLILSLPSGHPLHYAFHTYADATTDAGIVDGFLHQGDRGFTALHLDALIAQAGMQPAFWFHRPWAQPARLASALHWAAPDATLLHHADLWQELRGNFVPCLVRKDAPSPARPLRLNPAIPVRWGSIFGLNLGSRLSEERVRLSATQVRALGAWVGGGAPPDAELRALALEAGLVLGGDVHRGVSAASPPETWEPRTKLERGERAANPLYGHLFDAFRAGGVERWGDFGDPLEEEGEWGLTPLGTWKRRETEVRAWLESPPEEAEDYSAVRYVGEEEGRRELRAWLSGHSLPRRTLEDWEERELWVLLATHQHLFLPTR